MQFYVSWSAKGFSIQSITDADAVQVDLRMVEAKPVEESTANGSAPAAGTEGTPHVAALAEADETVLPVVKPRAVQDVSLMQEHRNFPMFA